MRRVASGLAAALAVATIGVSVPARASDPVPVASSPTDLGTLGGAGSTALGVSGHTVVGFSDRSRPGPHAFRYDLVTGRMTDLGTLGGRSSSASDVSGRTVVGSSGLSGSDRVHAFAYDLATKRMTDLGTLGGPNSNAEAVSGQTVVGTSDLPEGGVRHAFAHDLATRTMTDLGTLGGTNSWATDVSGDIVVGSASLPGDDSTHAFAYDLSSGEMTDLGTVREADTGAAAVSGDTVVGDYVGPSIPALNSGSTGVFAYDLSTGTTTDLGTSVGNYVMGLSGDTMVGASPSAGWGSWWHGYAYDLTTQAATDLAPLRGGNESEAMAVSGDVVVGESDIRGDEAIHAVMWRMGTILRTQVVPSPFDIGRDRSAELRVRLSESARVQVSIKHRGDVVTRLRAKRGPAGLLTWTWRGRDAAGRQVHAGYYVAVVKATNLAGARTAVRVGVRVTR